MKNPRHGILGTRSYRTKKESAAFIYLRLSKRSSSRRSSDRAAFEKLALAALLGCCMQIS
jgi:hypothetical protein